MWFTVAGIVSTVADFYGILPEDIKGPSRKRQFVRPRQIAIYLARQLTSQSYPEIARRVGGRDHSTLIYSVEQISHLIKTDRAIADDVGELTARLTAGAPCNDNEKTVLPDAKTIEKQLWKRFREIRVARAMAYLAERKRRETERRLSAMDDMEDLSWRVSQYTKRPLAERMV